MTNVLITGAAGNLGGVLRRGLPDHGFTVRLTDINPIDDLKPDENFKQIDLRDGVAVAGLMDGVDAVVHFGAIPIEDTFGAIIEANIRGTYNVLEAERQAGARRVVFASTNHVIGFHRRTSTIDHHAAHRPDSYYGLSKAFGEDLGRLYADKHGFGVMCIRIGSCLPEPRDARHLMTWISERDLVQLVSVGLRAPDLHFEVVYGMSDNERRFWNNENAYRLGYKPEDRSQDHAERIMALAVPENADPVALQFQGGVFTSAGFDSDPDKVK
ncbi:MAG: NAD(P)-dependent oxidoreductase [Pseudomonadota bacterium]